MEYTDVEFEEEFVIVPAHEPMISWVLVDEVEARELEEDHANRMRVKAVQKKFYIELVKISSMTGKSVAELSGGMGRCYFTAGKGIGSQGYRSESAVARAHLCGN